MYEYEGMYVSGKWSPTSGPEIEVRSPADGELLGRVSEATAADVDVAVEAARAALERGPWSRSTPAERAAAITALADAIESRTKVFADVVSAEVGSPRKWTTFGQLATTLGVYRSCAAIVPDYEFEAKRPSVMGGEVVVRRLPVGVVGAIVPWNAPLFTAALKMAPALAAGCTIVLKPSPDAPLGLSMLSQCIEEAGIPPGVINIVSGGVETGVALVAHPGVDKISFTGSTGAGKQIGAACAQDVRRVTLELGGKSAAVVLDDVVVDSTLIKGLVTGVMANNGQICAAQTRILLPRSRYDEILEPFAAAVAAMRIGDPAERDTEVGPVINVASRDRIETAVAAAIEAGARAVAGGSRPEGFDEGSYVSPTVLADVDNDMAIARDELFGPVAVVIAYNDDDDAVAVANDSEYGLAGAVWSADPERATRVATRMQTGSVSINSPAPLDFGSPFGGFKKSGIGREGGPEGIAAYLESQSIIL
ncbi:aldehyde dehydrogenase [Williamsia muralis]|uniref:Aldehyde dehydrogenase n=1 Tax=Williamsia marianensis TaxID=85044 RepID=A0ABU4F2K2_WILMA|nr:aldehyde dehydrogenase [Williamsia muralis]MDV7136436.1 aldehyde dehydrogenase [Williamsia muralis]